MRLLVLLAVCALGGAHGVSAQIADSTRVLEARIAELEQQLSTTHVRFSGEFISAFGVNTTRTGAVAHEAAFRIDRWFFTAVADLNEQVSFRVTTDVQPAASGNANKDALTLAYAHARWDVHPRLSLQAGMIPGGWVNKVNKVWGYRGVARVLPDEEKLLSMGVLGASAVYALPGSAGEIGVVAHNGQTRRPDRDAYKEFSGYALLTPVAAWPLVAGGHFSHSDAPGAAGLDRWGGLVGLRGTRGLLAVEYEARRTAGVTTAGYGLLGHLRLGRVAPLGTLSLVGLADLYDPDGAALSDQRLRTVAGVVLEVASGFNIALDYQQAHAPSEAFETYDGGFTDTDGAFFLHVFLKY